MQDGSRRAIIAAFFEGLGLAIESDLYETATHAAAAPATEHSDQE